LNEEPKPGEYDGGKPGVFGERRVKNAGKFSACKEYTYREKLNGQWIEDKFCE